MRLDPPGYVLLAPVKQILPLPGRLLGPGGRAAAGRHSAGAGLHLPRAPVRREGPAPRRGEVHALPLLLHGPGHHLHADRAGREPAHRAPLGGNGASPFRVLVLSVNGFLHAPHYTHGYGIMWG